MSDLNSDLGALGKTLAINSIKAYQKYISPYKGYSCAHAHIHGGLSCSGYAVSVIDDHGVSVGLELLFERFRACQSAANGDRSPGVWYCIPICIPLPCAGR